MRRFILFIMVHLLLVKNLDAQSILWANESDELYRCAENKLLLDISGYPYNELRVVPDTGIIVGSGGQYFYSVADPVDSVYFKVYHKRNLVAQKTYGLLFYPFPVAYVCNVCPYSDIYKSEILYKPELKVLEGRGSSIIEYEVVGFNIQTTIEEFVAHKSSTSGHFTEEMLSLVRNLSRGSIIFFEDIKYKTPDGIINTIPPFNYRIRY